MVSTDVPGCRHVVLHEQSGLLVSSQDSHQLADALAILIQNADLRGRFGQQARLHAEREFSNEKIISQLYCIYGELLEATGRFLVEPQPITSTSVDMPIA